MVSLFAAGKYFFKVNNRDTRTKCKICSKLTIKTTERRHSARSEVFIVNSEHISHFVLVFLLTLSRSITARLPLTIKKAAENCGFANQTHTF